MRSKLAKVLSQTLMVSLIFFLVLDVILLVSSPFWLKAIFYAGPVDVTRGGETSISVSFPSGTYSFMLGFVILSGIVLGAILLESARILRNVNKGHPFSMANARAFQRSAWFSLAQMALFIAKMFNKPSLLTLGCAGIFLLATLLYFVLADLFHSAALLREDNDLTI